MIPGALGFPRYGSSPTPFGGLGSLRDSPLNPADPFGALARPGFPPSTSAGVWPLKVGCRFILNYFQMNCKYSTFLPLVSAICRVNTTGPPGLYDTHWDWQKWHTNRISYSLWEDIFGNHKTVLFSKSHTTTGWHIRLVNGLGWHWFGMFQHLA